MNVLMITPDFKIACGRSYYAYLLLKYLKKLGHNVYLLTNSGDTFERLNECGIEYFVLNSLHSNILYALTQNSEKIINILIKYKIDIIHTLHRKSEFIAVQILKKYKINNIRTVLTSLSLVKRKYYVEYRSDKIIAISDCILKMLTKKFNVPEKKIVKIPVMIEYDSSINISSVIPEKKQKIILFIGRFHKEKNLKILFEAVEKIRSNKIKIIAIGEGEEIFNYKKIIKEMKIDVEFILPKLKLGVFFQKSDICVLPSQIEPFPTFMLHAGLYKKPFIGSDVDGISELIVHKKNGLLFSRNNAEDLKSKIENFLVDNSLANKCANNLYNDIVKNYFVDKLIYKIESVYLKLMSN